MTARAQYDQLEWFGWDEFNHPDQMYLPFLLWIDKIRAVSEVPLIVTSDYRSPEANASTPGAFARSLHTQGRAIDVRWPVREDGKSDGVALAKIVAAVTSVRADSLEGLYELGLEANAPGGKHIHIGLFPEGRGPWMFVR